MRELLIVFDSVRYDQFLWSNAENLKSLGKVHRAYSHGRWTRPSMASILSGYLPYSPEVKNPWEPSWAYLNFGGSPRYFFNTSPWCRHMEPIKGMCLNYDPPRQAKKIVYEMTRTNNVPMMIVLFTETHAHYWFEEETEEDREFSKEMWNYNHGEDNPDLPERAMLKQIESIEYLDELLKPLLDGFKGRVYFTSDHGELFGEHHRIGHDPSFPHDKKLFEVPLIVGEI